MGGAGPHLFADRLFVQGVGIGMEQSHGNGFHPFFQQGIDGTADAFRIDGLQNLPVLGRALGHFHDMPPLHQRRHIMEGPDSTMVMGYLRASSMVINPPLDCMA